MRLSSNIIDEFAALRARTPGEVDADGMIKIGYKLIDSGLAPILLHPGSKSSFVDNRTPGETKKDDTETRKRLREAGHPNPDGEDSGRGGHKIGTLSKHRWRSYVNRWYETNTEQPNIAAALLGSRWVVLDADHASSIAGTRALLREWTGLDYMFPTVRSPGVYDGQDWKHKDGGHYWFRLPADADGEYEDFDECGRVIDLGQGMDLMVSRSYVMLPTSVRAEGPYDMIGEVIDAPAQLIEILKQAKGESTVKAAERAERRVAREQRRAQEAENPTASEVTIDTWSASVPWSDILTPAGWTPTRHRKECGCPCWTGPGDHASPISATAHDPGCTLLSLDGGHGSIHFWTSSLPAELTGLNDLTKIQFVAHMWHGGNLSLARRAVGIPDPMGGLATEADMALALISHAPKGEPVTEAAETDERSTVLTSVEKNITGVLGRDLTDRETSRLRNVVRRGFNPDDRQDYPEGYHSDLALVKEIMNFSDHTRAVYHYAVNSTPAMHPTLFLLEMLMRVARRVPPTLKSPTSSPLSFYLVKVGPSGSGKSLSHKPGPWEIPYFTSGPSGQDGWVVPDPKVADAGRGIGSGQALADLFTRKLGPDDPGFIAGATTRVMSEWPVASIVDDEMSGLLDGKFAALNALLSAWAGAAFGDDSRGGGSTRVVGDYTITYSGGIQPLIAAGLLDTASTGFLQRTLALPSAYGYKFVKGLVPDPGTLAAPEITIPAGTTKLSACDELWDALEDDEDRAAVDGHLSVGDNHNSHQVQMRIRLASLFALFHGQLRVTSEMWEWTGKVIEMHRRTLAFMEAGADHARANMAERKGFDLADAQYGRITRESKVRDTLRQKVWALVEQKGEAYLGSLSRSMSAAQRAELSLMMKDPDAFGSDYMVVQGSRAGSFKVIAKPSAPVVPITINQHPQHTTAEPAPAATPVPRLPVPAVSPITGAANIPQLVTG